MRRGTVCARVQEACVFRHADICLLCILWQFSMLRLLMQVEDARGDHMEEESSRAGLMTAMSVSFCLPHAVAVSVFYYV